MRINHNIAALNTYRQLGNANSAQMKSMEKLSSGMRINKAGDDAAGLAISEKMRGQIRGLDMASKNAQDAISMISTAEGGLNETHAILQRMRELSVQASNETLEGDDRTAIGDELKQLAEEIDRISTDTQFNGKTLLNGSLSTKLDATSTLVTGTLSAGGSATAVALTEIDVTNVAGGLSLELTGNVSTGELTLTDTISNKTQTITVNEMDAADTQELNFSDFGVKLSLASTADDQTAASIVEGVVGSTDNTTKNTIKTLKNGSATFAIGANEGQNMTLSFNDMSTSSLGETAKLNTLVTDVVNNKDIVDTSAKAQDLITVIDEAIKQVSTERSKFGAAQNRLEHTINNLSTSSENLTAAESRIRDVDMAKEMMEQTKNAILAQASQAMLAQANQLPQGVLQLLR